MRRCKRKIVRQFEKRGGSSGNVGGSGNNDMTPDFSSNDTKIGQFTVLASRDVIPSQQQAWMTTYDEIIPEFLSDDIQETFLDNLSIGRSLLETVSTNPNSIRAVQDSDGNMQAAASITIRSNTIYLDLLATAPWNITRDDSRSVRGAARALVAAIVRESIRIGKNGQVELFSLTGSEPFYESIGFRPTPDGNHFLSAEAARRFISLFED